MYPTLLRRYVSSLIDGLLLIAAATVVAFTLQGDGSLVVGLRLTLIFGLILLYEPLLTSRSATVGQRLTGIRVRRADDHTKRIGIPQAYLRILVKLPLGFLSFFSMGFNKERRALHDFATGSVMVFAKEAEDLATP